MHSENTKEPQYQNHVTLKKEKGLTKLGLRANATWDVDPRRLVFSLARYKFVSKMLSGKQKVLEVGCGDAFGSRIVLQEVKSLCVLDFDPVFMEDVRERMDEDWKFEIKIHDMLSGPLSEKYDAAYCLDVLEHIPAVDEHIFIKNISDSLENQGVLIVGMPSLESQTYASDGSKEGHVNCKSMPQLKALMQEYFSNVFMFSMNDEVVHTGYYAMAHYLFALCVGKK